MMVRLQNPLDHTGLDAFGHGTNMVRLQKPSGQFGLVPSAFPTIVAPTLQTLGPTWSSSKTI